MKNQKNRVLVVAISPPPYGGQAMMVQTMLDSEFDGIQLYHVRMAFSSSMKSIGRFEMKKVFHMFEVVFRAIIKKYQHRTSTLYYVPGGSGKIPVIRDIFILFFLRMISRKVIFHFHAAGVSEVVEVLPGMLRKMAQKLYGVPDLAIFLSGRNPDNKYFQPRESMIIPNGLADAAEAYFPLARNQEILQLLFVGVVQESKGVMTLLEAVRSLKNKGVLVHARIVGEFHSEEFRNRAQSFCNDYNIQDQVQFTGVLIGERKWKEFASADVFCFPSFFESESFGNVLVEAMMFELPVIGTEWRGIPDIVEDGTNGFLIPIRSPEKLAEKIEVLRNDKNQRIKMGKKGREKYLSQYSLHGFVSKLQTAFDKLGES